MPNSAGLKCERISRKLRRALGRSAAYDQPTLNLRLTGSEGLVRRIIMKKGNRLVASFVFVAVAVVVTSAAVGVGGLRGVLRERTGASSPIRQHGYFDPRK